MSYANEQGWTKVARSKEMKHEIRRNAEQQAAKQAQKQQKREAARAKKTVEKQPDSKTALAKPNVPPTSSSGSPSLVIPELIARVCTLPDIIRDVKVYLVNRAAFLNNTVFTVRNLCESRDLFYKRETVMKALQELLGNGFVRLISSDGEELFSVVEKALVEEVNRGLGPEGSSRAAASTSSQVPAAQQLPSVASSSSASTSSAAAAGSSVHTAPSTSAVSKSSTTHPNGCDQCTESHATHCVSMGPAPGNNAGKKYAFFVPASAAGRNYDGTPAFKWHDIMA
jgi:hypothetical protein